MIEFVLCMAFLMQAALWYIVGFTLGHRQGQIDQVSAVSASGKSGV